MPQSFDSIVLPSVGQRIVGSLSFGRFRLNRTHHSLFRCYRYADSVVLMEEDGPYFTSTDGRRKMTEREVGGSKENLKLDGDKDKLRRFVVRQS